MRRRLFLLLLALGPFARAQLAPVAPADDDLLKRPVQRVILPGGEELMAEVRERLPRERREIFARLKVRVPGAAEREIRAESMLHFGGNPARAEYLLLDGLGTSLEKLVIAWKPDGTPEFAFSSGPDLKADPAFQPARAVAGLDFTWNDLSLAFLWWPGAQVRGMENRKLRSCYVVEIPAPAAARDQGAAVRLWVDQKEKLVMQAAVIDENGDEQRTIEVKDLQKIKGTELWMLKDLEIRNRRTGLKAELRVDEVR